MGTDGGLPGGQAIEYQLKAKATPILVTPFTATATPPAGTPTATLPAGTPTATATRTYTPTLTGTPTRTATATRGVYGNGDANKDGRIDSIDASIVLQHDAGLYDLGPRFANADVNQDGEITSVDATIILQYNGGLITTLPRPR
jgi:hypothetical protein